MTELEYFRDALKKQISFTEFKVNKLEQKVKELEKEKQKLLIALINKRSGVGVQEI
jgi:hypothetical protein|tara:strand:+ start:635 stop:802 length:168 start_codon:yes stop_codon:yes gene_type:complete